MPPSLPIMTIASGAESSALRTNSGGKSRSMLRLRRSDRVALPIARRNGLAISRPQNGGIVYHPRPPRSGGPLEIPSTPGRGWLRRNPASGKCAQPIDCYGYVGHYGCRLPRELDLKLSGRQGSASFSGLVDL